MACWGVGVGSGQTLAVADGITATGLRPFELRFTDGSSGLYLLQAMSVDVVVGDLDGDGTVGAADLAILLGSWGPCGGCPADLNGDDTVGPADLAMLLGNWG